MNSITRTELLDLARCLRNHAEAGMPIYPRDAGRYADAIELALLGAEIVEMPVPRRVLAYATRAWT